MDSNKYNYSRIQMPVNMTMQKPWTRIISHKPESDIIASSSNIDSVSLNRIHIVCNITTGTSYDGECVLF